MKRFIPSSVDLSHAASVATLLALCCTLASCTHDERVKYPTTDQQLRLDRVVLYRNGVGYFERTGPVEGNLLRI
ncbi:MAG: hypothetical protein JRI23_10460, partial [Deltaproteobacteria bacterium]|nr:hypothetical protein [Deltaproteobacteria bacterium]MBW2532093.1 hypothetical protein [Deltaproteobacteria bacterium]